LAIAGLLSIGVGAALSACSNSGVTLAKQACGHINQSIALLQESDRTTGGPDSARLKLRAYDQLRTALPLASEAAYRDGQWQALMTTVAESNRVPESILETALKAQCASADSSIFGQTPPPSSIPPPPPSATP
jgi:hypothetical protein